MNRAGPTIQAPPPRRKALLVALAMASAALLTGCVPAESTRYRGTVSGTVTPARSANADVAGAFGMRESNDTSVNLAATKD